MFDDVDLQVKERYEDPSYYVGKCADCDNAVMLVLGQRCSHCEDSYRRYLEKTLWNNTWHDVCRLNTFVVECRWIGAR
jgi:hypothetical protein